MQMKTAVKKLRDATAKGHEADMVAAATSVKQLATAGETMDEVGEEDVRACLDEVNTFVQTESTRKKGLLSKGAANEKALRPLLQDVQTILSEFLRTTEQR